MSYGVAPDASFRQREMNTSAEIAAGAIPAASMGVFGVLALTIPDGADGDVDFTNLPVAIRVVDFWVVTTADPGANANTIQLQTSVPVAVTDALSINGVGDNAIVRAGTLNDAQHTFILNATIRVRRVRIGGTAACIAYVKYMRV